MRATDYQHVARTTLAHHFEPAEIKLDWVVGRTSAVLSAAPAVDLAVGPLSVPSGPSDGLEFSSLPPGVRTRLERFSLVPNEHASCLLAIEVSFNGSPKHVLGDLVNASALGVIGIVIGQDDSMGKLHRNLDYLRAIAGLGACPQLYRNVLALRPREFEQLFA